MLLALLLFITLAALLLAVFYAGEYETSPAVIAYDAAKGRFFRYLFRGDREALYQVTRTDPARAAKLGLLIGAVLGLVVALIAGGVVPFLLVPLFALGGLLLFDAAAGVEYNRWRDRVFDGIPTLVHFFPSFLETGAITPRRAMELTVPFLPEPLRSEMAKAVHQLSRTGRVEALSELARKAKNPVVDAVCFRLQATWDVGVRPDVFADLDDQIKNMEEVAAARATAARSGMIAFLCLIALVGSGWRSGTRRGSISQLRWEGCSDSRREKAGNAKLGIAPGSFLRARP
ncbi:MAG: hypothetical protein K6U04_15225 [Armatimonadetes bacterium]|nr:hypothetical protein [Armatimonadota bacterium]